jgi:transposase
MSDYSHTPSDTTSSRPQRIEVITSVQRRRRWAPAEKKQMVDETYEAGMTVSYVARKYGISSAQLFQWRRKYEDGALVGVASEEKLIPESEHKKALERIRRLERLLGQKTEENECLKDAVRLAREKKLISRKPLPGIEDTEPL